VLFPTCQLDTICRSLPCEKRHVARLRLMCFLGLDGVTVCKLMSLYSIYKLTMMNVCIEWRIVTQSAMTVNARLHKCHTRITPELYTECSVAPFRLRLLLHPPRHSPLVLSQSFIYQPQPHSTFSYINRLPQIHKQRGILQ